MMALENMQMCSPPVKQKFDFSKVGAHSDSMDCPPPVTQPDYKERTAFSSCDDEFAAAWARR